MKNILIIAYYYPPKGGAGVQRVSKFAKYLSKEGYNVSVLTVKEEASGIVDKSLKRDINGSIKVYRTYIKEVNVLEKLLSFRREGSSSKDNDTKDSTVAIQVPTKLSKFKSKLIQIAKKIFLQYYNLINIPDDKKGWIKYAVTEGSKIIENDKIDMIISSSAPYSCHIIAEKLSKKYNIKWIADFRDPWVSNAFADHGTFLKVIYKYFEKKIVKNSDRIISVSKPIINDFINRYPEENKNKFIVIPNGYDEDDFTNLDLANRKNQDRLIILYNGTLYGIESPESLLKALDKLIKEGKIDKNKILFKFTGNVGYEQQKILDKYEAKYRGIIEQKKYLPHSESIKQFSDCDALLLILSDMKGVEGIYTGKLFEYIRAGKPIIGIVPDGVAKELILETNTGYVAHPSDLGEIEKVLYKVYNNYINHVNPISPNWEQVKKYSRENLTKELIRVMSEIKD